MSSQDLLKLMNDRSLLTKGPANVMAGNNRDADGSIDRVRDPPESLKPMLKKIKRQIDLRNMDLHSILEDQGGTRFGTMSTNHFNSTLVTHFAQEILFSEEDLLAISGAYGTGTPLKHQKGMFEFIAWMDFVEDINKTNADFMPESMAPPLALTKQPMSAQAMMLDAMDGKVDGVVDDSIFEHRQLMGDKRWA